ncbi:hypothetical protein QAD02_006382 [Eretmocerus hayati]|uniref:Uncharacterized protein n=1 Tax=Eretmocerus hayati TaxID=131215 RepID=A0ACC2N0Q8_9HYME|nr:hypothetical protein QAD02_006382 [Eretmocerus hayati]
MISFIADIRGVVVPKIANPFARIAEPNEFPFQVSIQINCQHVCGGSLISIKHVLTAAHCIDRFIQDPNLLRKQSLTVEVGSREIGKGITHDIERISHVNTWRGTSEQRPDLPSIPSLVPPQPGYLVPNDIAVITLMHPIQESKWVKPIGIYMGGPLIGQRLTVIGFGSLQSDTSTSPYLKVEDIQIISHEKCMERWFPHIVLESQICANLEFFRGICNGDSGGPLFFKTPEKYFLVGIVSAGDKNCGAGEKPDLFTKASSFVEYIGNEMAYGSPRWGTFGAKAINLHARNGGSPSSRNSKCKPGSGAIPVPESRLLVPELVGPSISRPPRHNIPPLNTNHFPFQHHVGYLPPPPVVYHPEPSRIHENVYSNEHPQVLPITDNLSPPFGGHPVLPTSEFLNSPPQNLIPAFWPNQYSLSNPYEHGFPSRSLQLELPNQPQNIWQVK